MDAVDYITVCNLANLDAAIHGLLLDVIEVQLKFVGKGPGYVHGCDGNS